MTTVPEIAQFKVHHAVLDHGHVRLESAIGGDLSVVNSARVSFATQHETFEDSDGPLINYLMRERHGTPFEHNSFTFNVKCPLFVAREWQRHRMGSFNEWSARYSKLNPEFYIPEYMNVRTRVGKPGRYTYEPVEEGVARDFQRKLLYNSNEAFGYYQDALDLGIAPEQARMFLPVNIYTQFYWTVNARSMMNFLSLRNAPTAQWEIQQYAKAVEQIFELHMPVTHASFVSNGRIAP